MHYCRAVGNLRFRRSSFRFPLIVYQKNGMLSSFIRTPEDIRRNMNIPSNQDTIAAIATARGESAIAIVRLSGPEAYPIADRTFACRPPKLSQRPPRTFVLGRLFERGAEGGGLRDTAAIDEAIALLFRAPHSFTRQDVIEFQCHGGEIAAQRVYRTLLAEGARPAEPGEFTRRAFLSGRLDLIRAEAVIDLIKAQTIRAAKTAAEQLSGSLSISVEDIYNNIMTGLAEIEARLDFPDDEMPPLEDEHWQPSLASAADATAALLSTWDQGRLLRQGAVVVIAGCVNAGKSTLLNALLGQDRAIVSSQPGTTRDSIEEGFQLHGIPIRLVDTAGYRQTACSIEKSGMERSDSLRRTADALLYVIDASEPLQDLDLCNLEEAPPDRTILVFNKIDLGIRIQRKNYPGFPAVFTNLGSSGMGAEPVKKILRRVLGGDKELNSMPLLIGERHRNLLQEVYRAVGESVSLLREDGEEHYVTAAVVLREALSNLDECLGRSFSTELLDTVFSRFCIGK